MRSAADLIMGVWTAPEVPLLVEYPLDLMEDLRALLSDELQQLSRAGRDVAGVLFGVSRGPAIRVLAWRPIHRVPADDQSARLSRNDRAEMVRVLGNAASDPEMRGFEPLGWFVSHADGGRGLTGADVELFNNFFPHSWQVTLLLRRGTGGTARAGFFVREPDGFLRPDASYRELLIQPVRRMPGATSPKSPQQAVPPSQETPQPFAKVQPESFPAGAPSQDPFLNEVPVPRVVAVDETTPLHAPDQTSTHIGVKPHSPLDPEAVSDIGLLSRPPRPEETAVSGKTLSGKEPVAPEATAPAENPASVAAHPAIQPPASSAAEHPLPPIASPAAIESAVPATTAPETTAPQTAVPKTPARKTAAPKTIAPTIAPSTAALATVAPETTAHATEAPETTAHATTAPKTIAPDTTAPETTTAETPSFSLQAHSFGGSRWLWVISVLVVLAGVVFLVMQKGTPAPAPTFSLRVGTVNDSVEISWDRDSIPVRNGEYASIQVQLGANSKQISLSSNELHAGTSVYLRESGDVAVQMTIYGAGREFHEFARLVNRPVPATTARPEPQPQPTSQLRTERDSLQNQLQLLKEQVRKEAARADQAEDVVRILENRLKIDSGRTRPEEKK